MNKTAKILKHFFVPHRGNAFRPHALRHKVLSVYTFGLILSQLVFGITLNSGPILMAIDADAAKENIIAYSNLERQNQGLKQLTENNVLNQAAKLKLNDMFTKDYWDHIGPNGEEAWQFFEESGYQFNLAGENLAKGFSNTKDVVKAWMASPTHRENLLNNRFSEIGIAVGSGKINGATTTVVVQLLGEPRTLFAAQKTQDVLGETKITPELSLNNITSPSKTPYFVAWVIIFALVVMDGVMIRKLGLHASRSHVFNFRVALLLIAFSLGFLAFGFTAIT